MLLVCVCSVSSASEVEKFTNIFKEINKARAYRWSIDVYLDNPEKTILNRILCEESSAAYSLDFKQVVANKSPDFLYKVYFDGESQFYTNKVPSLLFIKKEKPKFPPVLFQTYPCFVNYSFLNAHIDQKKVNFFMLRDLRLIDQKALAQKTLFEKEEKVLGDTCNVYLIKNGFNHGLNSEIVTRVWVSKLKSIPLKWQELFNNNLLVEYVAIELGETKVGLETVYYPLKSKINYYAWDINEPQKLPINAGFRIDCKYFEILDSKAEVAAPDPSFYKGIYDEDKKVYILVP